MADRMPSSSLVMESPVPRYARPIVILSLLIAAAVYIAAPIMAYSWATRVPFLGVTLEQTFTVNEVRSDTWGPSADRLNVLYHIQAINGRPIDSQATLEEVLIASGVDSETPVEVTYVKRGPGDALTTDTISVRLSAFPLRDLFRLFWLPYLIGLTYLGIGIWVFRFRGHQRAALTFVYFTTWIAVILGVLFDLYSTHVLSGLWPVGFAIAGAATFHLAAVFPQEPRLVEQRPAFRLIPYIPATLLAVNALVVLRSLSDPWAYIDSWGLLYIFAVLGLIVFYGTLIYRRIASTSPIARQQSRIILWGSLPAFVPFAFWVVLGQLGLPSFDSLIYLPPLVLFPLAVAYAIVRYRLLDVDQLITRSLTYLVITVIVVGAYLIIANAIRSALEAGDTLATDSGFLAVFILIVAVLLDPLRQRVQNVIDRVFYRSRIETRGMLQGYSRRLTGAADLDAVVSLLCETIDKAIGPELTRLYLYNNRTRSYLLHGTESVRSDLPALVIRCSMDSAFARWLNEQSEPWYIQPDRPLPKALSIESARIEAMGASLFVPLRGPERLDGWVALGGKRSGQPFTTDEMNFLSALAGQTTLALERALTYSNLERRVSELNVLSQISQAINFRVEVDDILELIYAQTSRVLDTSNFYIALINPRRETMRYAFYVENNERLYPDDEWPIDTGLNGIIIRTGRPIVTDDYWQECINRGITPGGKPGRAWMGVPLAAEDRTFGVMNVSSFELDVTYTREQLKIFSAIADQAASVMEKVRLFKANEEHARRLAVLNEVSNSITSSLDLPIVLNTIMQKAVEILAAEAGSLLLVDDDEEELVFEVILGPAASKLRGQRLPIGAGIVGSVAQTGQPQIVSNAQTDTRWLRDIGQTEEFITRAMVTVPMIARDRVVGVIQLLNKRDGTTFSEDDQTLLESFAGNAAVAVENAQLFSRTDLALGQRVEELSLLQELDRELNISLDFSRVMNLTLEWGARLTGAEAGWLGMISEEEEDVEPGLLVIATNGETATWEQKEGTLLPLERGFAGKAIHTQQAQLVNNFNGSPDEAALLADTRSQISAPIRRGSRIIGVLNLESTRDNAFDESQFESATRLADHAAIAIANARLYEEVKRANEAKSEFVSIVSHELKTPMTSIKGYTDLMVQGASGPLNELQQQFLNTIRSNVNRMSTLVSDLLDISRIETGRLKLDIRPESLPEIIEETLRTTQRQIEEKSQELELALPADLPEVMVDRARIIQVMTNLISNAYKYTPNGGQIQISATYRTNGVGEYVMCAVKDSGVGMSEEDLSKLFTKFFRSSNPAVRDVPGTGLGLSITKSLIELHGGQIWVESELGNGTTFSFSMPTVNGAAAAH